MESFLDQLNLTPQERRIVVVIAVVVFVVLNMLLVWPHFGDLGRVKRDLESTRGTMKEWNAKILLDVDPGPNGLKKKLEKLESQQGGGVGNQQVQLQKSIYDQAIKTGVTVGEYRPVNSTGDATNEFYEEQSLKITFECQEPQLVNFLFNVGNDPAMIRVRELNLRTADANRYGLKGDAFLSANYAKQPPKAGPAGAKPAGATAPGKSPTAGPNPAVKIKTNAAPATPKQPFSINRAPAAQPSR